MYFIKLAILISGCPRDMYITNFTRKPPQMPSIVKKIKFRFLYVLNSMVFVFVVVVFFQGPKIEHK